MKKIQYLPLLIALFVTMFSLASCDGTDPEDATGSNTQVWMSYRLNPATGYYENFEFVIFPNNDCLDYLPENGLINFSRATDPDADLRIWGVAVDKGNELHLEYSNGTVRRLGKVSSTKMSYPPGSTSSFYYKCMPVTGLKISGAYSPEAALYEFYQSTSASSITPDPTQEREIIFFYSDGSYYNEGLGYGNITFGDDSIYGSGTYEIKDYSIQLRTASGKIWQIAFTGINDFSPFTDQSGFMINGLLNYKLGN